MNIHRQEIRTGLFFVLTLSALVTLLLYLGAPGTFVAQHRYEIYFENAGGLKPGGDVMLAGRKVGTVSRIESPVAERSRPELKYEVLIEVEIYAATRLYRNARAFMVEPSLLGDPIIDFSGGREAGGLAPEGMQFLGQRVPGLNAAVPAVLEKIDPTLERANVALDSLQQSAAALTRLASDEGDLPKALSEFRQFGVNLNALSGEQSALRNTMANFEELTATNGKLDRALGHVEELLGPEGALAQTFKNSEKLTREMAANGDWAAALKNARSATRELKGTVATLGPQLNAVGRNLEQASDTVKRQPWRLIWPSTKKYPEDQPAIAAGRSKRAPPICEKAGRK